MNVEKFKSASLLVQRLIGAQTQAEEVGIRFLALYPNPDQSARFADSLKERLGEASAMAWCRLSRYYRDVTTQAEPLARNLQIEKLEGVGQEVLLGAMALIEKGVIYETAFFQSLSQQVDNGVGVTSFLLESMKEGMPADLAPAGLLAFSRAAHAAYACREELSHKMEELGLDPKQAPCIDEHEYDSSS